ncbi:MAG: chorismate-binding protein [Planctomycetota bacterium]
MTGVTPSFDEFSRLAERYGHVPLVATLIFDDLTPLSAFARLQADSQRAFLLESVVGGESVARYSFVGADPAHTFEVTRDHLRIHEHRTAHVDEQPTTDPLADLDHLLRRHQSPTLPGLPHFLGGAVGYVAYDTVRYYEPLPAAPLDDRGLPDLLFDLYESLVIFDHVGKLVRVVAHAEVPPAAGAGELRHTYRAAVERIEWLIERLGWAFALEPARVALPEPPTQNHTSNLTPTDFDRIVSRCQAAIAAGQVTQVVPSQRLLVETAAEPLNIYRALRVIDPSPFMFYLKGPRLTVLGASPEMMCRVEDGVVTTRPLAGTRRRGATPEEDERLRAELLADPRERAGHETRVDLSRRDLERVSRHGTVQVRRPMTAEVYSRAIHLSSTLSGVLREGLTALDALRAVLPVGAVCGAPKLPAMELVDACEPTRRGPFGGAVGYVDFAGHLDSCIAVRTLVVQPAGNERHNAWVQAGTPVFADTAPQEAYQRSLTRASSLLSAIHVAEERFVI